MVDGDGASDAFGEYCVPRNFMYTFKKLTALLPRPETILLLLLLLLTG